MARIAMIGAGSIVFTKTLLNDLLATPALRGSTFALMSRTAPKLEKMAAFAQRMVDENGLDATIEWTLDRREALAGADFVINMIQVGGLEAFELDMEVPLKFGVDQCIGDTLGPGGVFRTLRTVPVVMDLVHDMRELCPRALLLNYTNPMATICWALGEAGGVEFIGLCHGVQTTLDLIARYVDVPKDEIDHFCAGINHMAWFLRLEHQGRDLYPTLRANIERPEYYQNEKVRCEVMRQLGYFMTESTGHLSEYLPWFRSSRRALDLYCDQPDFGGETGAYLKWCRHIGDKFTTTDPLSLESPKLAPRSVEYCSYIIEALLTDQVFRLNGNVKNHGLISNLPPDCCAEVPIFVDRKGLHPTFVGELPPLCAAANRTNTQVQELAVHAALRGDPELAFGACAFDPLTAACCTLAEIRKMTAALLEAEKPWLPQFADRTLRATPVISIPQDVKPVDVPLDPALAIVHRFGKLAG